MENSNVCPNTKDIIICGQNPSEKRTLFFNPGCGSWSCPVCWEKNRDEWLHTAMRGTLRLMDAGNQVQFVTLTGRGYFTPVSSVYFMRQNWPKLRKRIEYHTNAWSDVTGTHWAYLLVPERHKDGRAHWHIIASTWEDRARWWKDNAHECGLGYIAHVRRIDNSLAAGAYVAKYLTKDAGGIQWPKGFRRVRTSKNWPKVDNVEVEKWEYQQVSAEQKLMLIADAEIVGWSVTDLTEW